MNFLNEVIDKGFLGTKKKKVKQTSDVNDKSVLINLSGDSENETNKISTVGVFDGNYLNETRDKKSTQASKIVDYRALALNPEVSNAIDKIVNEIVFSYDDKPVLKSNIETGNDTLDKKISEEFDYIINTMNVNRNMFSIVRQAFIDGQMVFHMAFDEQRLKKGIIDIKMIEPCFLVFDKKTNTYRYDKDGTNGSFYGTDVKNNSYSVEEIVIENFGLYDGKIVLSYLEWAAKNARMLTQLEDLLIPLRFSRSVSRRVFNVDVGKMQNNQVDEYISKISDNFKYKKYLDSKTGEIKNQNSAVTMIEDYWLPSREGSKGTSVQVLDESGNLGELGDINYYLRKLYRSLKIPESRIPEQENNGVEFNFESSSISQDDLEFFMFINRLRMVFTNAIKLILKRQCISMGFIIESEWDKISDGINIVFSRKNTFIEKMEIDMFMSKIEKFSESENLAGRIISYKTLIKTIFDMTEEELEEERKLIEEESKDKFFKKYIEAKKDEFR